MMISKLLLPVAVLMIAGAFGSPAAVAGEPVTQDLKVQFTYSPSASAADVYSGLTRTARDACSSAGRRSLQQQMQEKACAKHLLDSAVTRIGRADVAQLHQNQSGPYASAG